MKLGTRVLQNMSGILSNENDEILCTVIQNNTRNSECQFWIGPFTNYMNILITGTLVFDLDIQQDFMWPWPFLAGDGRAHMTADEMDEQRKQNVAYEYLCHLEEAKVFVF